MNELNLELLQKLCNNGDVMWTLHAIKRVRERKIKMQEVLDCIQCGEIIEQYPSDKPLPSCLISAIIKTKQIHAVVSSDGKEIYIITAYIPTLDDWESDYKTRKEQTQ